VCNRIFSYTLILGHIRIYALTAVIEQIWRCTGRLRSSELRDALVGRDQTSFEMHLETQKLSVFRDAIGSRDEASLEIHLEDEIEWAQRCTWRPWLSEFRDALGGRDRLNSEIHLEAMIEWIWRCTRRPRLYELRDALGSRNWLCWKKNLEVMVVQYRTSTWRRLIRR